MCTSQGRLRKALSCRAIRGQHFPGKTSAERAVLPECKRSWRCAHLFATIALSIMRHAFALGSVQASISKADARDLDSEARTP